MGRLTGFKLGYTMSHRCRSLIKKMFQAQYVEENITWEKAYELINEHEIISFDIFDTLLVRPYKKPTDLFWDLEKREKAVGFAQERIDAEKRTREKYFAKEDITFEQIYEEIALKYQYLQDKEMALEREVLECNKQICALYKHLQKEGKRIIITSDMYLSKAFLEKILEEKGIQGYEELFVSSETMKTKASGNMYKFICKSLHVKPGEILHIGDDLYSDGNALRKGGMQYVFVRGNTVGMLRKK